MNDLFFCRDLTVRYRGAASELWALEGVDIALRPGCITAVIGESGSGKTTLARALLGLVGPETAEVRCAEMRLPRRIGYMGQEPSAALHPLITVGDQVSDCLRFRNRTDRRRAKREAGELLTRLGLDPGEYYGRYAHTLSGGEAQRIVLARALAMDAEMLIADEPTSQLDPVSQADAVRLIYALMREKNIATLLITHSLPLAAEVASRVYILEAGKVVDEGTMERILERPAHPYSRLLAEETRRVRACS